MKDSIETRISDYLAEKDEQRFGVEGFRILSRNGKVLEKMAELGEAHPDVEPGKLERVAVGDCLFDLETESNMIRLYAESVERYLDEYIEELGVDVPHELEHAQLSLWHLADDCRRFCEEYEGVRAWAGTLIERHTAMQ